LSPTVGAIIATPALSPNSYILEPDLEPIALPLHVYPDSPEIPEIIFSNPTEIQSVLEIPQVPKNKYIPPKQKQKKEKRKKKTVLQLKRTLYLKRIQLANMEINFKKKMYELELKIKNKELHK
jgi:hypothetical protein